MFNYKKKLREAKLELLLNAKSEYMKEFFRESEKLDKLEKESDSYNNKRLRIKEIEGAMDCLFELSEQVRKGEL